MTVLRGQKVHTLPLRKTGQSVKDDLQHEAWKDLLSMWKSRVSCLSAEVVHVTADIRLSSIVENIHCDTPPPNTTKSVAGAGATPTETYFLYSYLSVLWAINVFLKVIYSAPSHRLQMQSPSLHDVQGGPKSKSLRIINKSHWNLLTRLDFSYILSTKHYIIIIWYLIFYPWRNVGHQLQRVSGEAAV